MSKRGQRRTFLMGALSLACASQVRSQLPEQTVAEPVSPGAAPGEREVVLGIMGLHRGQALADQFVQLPQVRIKYVCDVDQNRLAASVSKLKRDQSAEPVAVADFRRILDDPEVDALVCAAPNHWHAPATILACAAGKHVYVEKPCCHNPWEGEQMVAAAQKHQRVVQMGSQRRSSPGTIQAIQQLHEGAIGRVYHARSHYFADRGTIGRGQPAMVPAHLDYELWQGPAPRRPYLDNLVHYNWHWRWHWGNGELGNNGVHPLDLCRWGMNVEFPQRVVSSGGRYCFQDDQETPDTHTVCFEFEGQRSVSWQGLSCNNHGNDFVVFYGDQGTLDLRSNGTFTMFDLQGRELAKGEEANQGDINHLVNFLDAVRQQDSKRLNAEIAEGYKSTLLCLLGNIAHRMGRVVQCDPLNGRIQNDPQAAQLWKRDYAAGWEPQV